ncbi:MAG: hypothetical protein ACM3QV_00065 [Caulobacteraceae bacterium]
MMRVISRDEARASGLDPGEQSPVGDEIVTDFLHEHIDKAIQGVDLVKGAEFMVLYRRISRV